MIKIYYKKQFLLLILSAFTIFKCNSFDFISIIKSKKEQISTPIFDRLVNKSKSFDKQTAFPTQANRIYTIAGSDNSKKTEIEKQASNSYPIIQKKVQSLINEFLSYKKQYGSKIEKNLYANMSEQSFIDRLLIKRPLMFMTESDMYLLRNGKQGQGGFEKIGTPNEKSPLVLRDYISYDEMQIAALIGVLVPTYFINNGNRFNKAIPQKAGTFQEKGIYVGLVGARFEKEGLMEWQHMIITPEQNTKENGYGPQADSASEKTKWLKMWASFYETEFVTFQEANTAFINKKDKAGRFIRIEQNMYLDSLIYKKRMQMVIEPFLIAANKCGVDQGVKVYVHAVGLGLGVWQKSPIQAKLMLEVYAEILRKQNLSQIADLDFSWFPSEYQSCGGVTNLEIFKTDNNEIKIHFSKRNPADRLQGDSEQQLLVAMYAWDGNAYPGNEYWAGSLSASGDPAAACCSTIPELQNPLINPNVAANKVLWTE